MTRSVGCSLPNLTGPASQVRVVRRSTALRFAQYCVSGPKATSRAVLPGSPREEGDHTRSDIAATACRDDVAGAPSLAEANKPSTENNVDSI